MGYTSLLPELKRRITSLGLLLLLASCCSEPDQSNTMAGIRSTGIGQILPDGRAGTIDPVFRIHVLEFEQLLGTSIGDVPITFGTTGQDTAAQCETEYTGEREIVVDRREWEAGISAYGPEYGEMLLFHELGHCVLNRGHTHAFYTFTDEHGDEYEAPASIMHPMGVPIGYKQFRDYYLAELFAN